MRQVLFVTIVLISPLFAVGSALAQAGNAGASATVEQTSRFNSSGAMVNADGKASGEDRRVIQKPIDSPAYSLKNLADGKSSNPYTGVAAGQPLQPYDLGR